MLKTGDQIRRDVISSLKEKATRHQKEVPEEKIGEYKKLKEKLSSMRRTDGWKIVEAWITEQLPVADWLMGAEMQEADRYRAMAYTRLLMWVEQMAEGALIPTKSDHKMEEDDGNGSG